MGYCVSSFASQRVLCNAKIRWATLRTKQAKLALSIKASEHKSHSPLSPPITRLSIKTRSITAKEKDSERDSFDSTLPYFLQLFAVTGIAWILTGQMHSALADSFKEYSAIIEQRTGQPALSGLTESPNTKVEEPRMKLETRVQAEVDKRRIQQLKEELKTARRASPAPYFSPQTPLPAPPSFEPRQIAQLTDTAGSVSESVEEDRTVQPGLLNSLGIVLAGGLAGYIFLKRKATEVTEAGLRQELDDKARDVLKLKTEVDDTVAVLNKERQLTAEIRQEKEDAERENSEKIQLLQDEKDAVAREVAATKKALEAERKVVEATEKEAKLVESALDAEKEAKASVETEIEEVKKELENTEGVLRRERSLAKGIGGKTRDLESQLDSAKATNAEFIEKNRELEGSLQAKSSEVNELVSQKSGLEKALSQTRADLKNQTENLNQSKAAVVSFEQTVQILEQERTELAESFLEKINQASTQRRQAEKELATLTSELDQERQAAKKVRAELERKNGYIADKDRAISTLESELGAAKEEVRHLHLQMSLVQSQYENSTVELESEKKEKTIAQEKIKRLDAELLDAWSQVESGTEDNYKSQQEIDRLKEEMEAIKRQYHVVSDKVEEEQSRLIDAQKTTAILSEQIMQLQGAKVAAEKRASDLSSQLEEAKRAAQEARERMAAEETAKSAVMQERDELKKELSSLEIVAHEARHNVTEAQKKLQEVMARTPVQEQVTDLKNQLKKPEPESPKKKKRSVQAKSDA